MQKKAFVPDPGVGFASKYTDKKTGEEVGYVKILIREAIPAGSKMVLFPKGGEKKKETDPDYILKHSISKAGSTPAPAQAVAAPAKKKGLPF